MFTPFKNIARVLHLVKMVKLELQAEIYLSLNDEGNVPRL